MPSNHLIICRPLLHLLSIFPSIKVFSSELTLCIRWPKCWSLRFSISPSNKYSGMISFRIDWLISLLSKGLSEVFSSTRIQKHQFFGVQPSLRSSSHIYEIKRRLLLGRKAMTNIDSILKSRDITLPTKVHLVKAMVFPVVMYGYAKGQFSFQSQRRAMSKYVQTTTQLHAFHMLARSCSKSFKLGFSCL